MGPFKAPICCSCTGGLKPSLWYTRLPSSEANKRTALEQPVVNMIETRCDGIYIAMERI